MSYGDQLRAIADQYRDAGQPSPATSKQMAVWAIREGLWKPHPSSLIEQCAEELSRAMREDYFTDAQGREVRAKHSARMAAADGQMRFMWDDIRTAKPTFMLVAFQQRRQQIVGDCYQLKMDVDSYNDNARPATPIQIVFDFRRDLDERAQPNAA